MIASRRRRLPLWSPSPWLAPTAEGLAILSLVPLAAALFGSLAGHGTGYVHWWGSARGWEALARTLAVAAPAAAVAVVLAWVLVSCAVRLSARWAAMVLFAACLPLLLPSSLLATAWIVALGKQGVATAWLREATGGVALNLYSMPGAAFVLALRYFGIAALVLAPGRLRREGEWPAARVFGIPRLAATVHLHLRAAVRPVLAGWLLVCLFSMNDHIIPGMLLVSTYGTQVLIQYSALLDPGGAAALAAPVAAIGAVLAGSAVLAGKRAWSSPVDSERPYLRKGRAAERVAAAAGAAVLLALALAVPMAVLARRTESAGAVADALASARDQVRQTILVACAAGVVTVAAGALLAGRWVRCRRTGERTLVPLVLVNLTVPASLLGMGMLELAGHRPLDAVRDTSIPLLAGCVVRFLPLVTLLLYALWRGEPPEAVLAARVHGVPRWRTAWTVLWPIRRAALLGAALVAGLLSATELEVSILLAPPGGSTLGVRLYSLIHTAPDSMVSALAVGMLVLAGPAAACLAALVASGRLRPGGATS